MTKKFNFLMPLEIVAAKILLPKTTTKTGKHVDLFALCANIHNTNNESPYIYTFGCKKSDPSMKDKDVIEKLAKLVSNYEWPKDGDLRFSVAENWGKTSIS